VAFIINGFRFATTSFAPTDIAGLQLWLDASDASSFTFSSGSVVSQWNDKSGNSRHMSQSTVANQPSRSGTQNGRSTVVFDGSNDYMTFDAGSDAIDISPWTWFAVVKDTSSGNSRRILSARRSATGSADFQAGGAIFGYRDTGPALDIFSAGATPASRAYSASTWFLGRSTVDGSSNMQVAVDSVAASSSAGSSSVNARYLTLGGATDPSGNPPLAPAATEVWLGEIAEVILYNAALSGTDISNVESYLRTKWGTP
jgi:hypothetical protein